MFDRSLFIRLFGYRAGFIHGDPMVLDRWRWVKRRLPRTRNGELLLDAGCGNGIFTIGAAKRGYRSTGLSWDEENRRTAEFRAKLVGVATTDFPIQDLRNLDDRTELREKFDMVLSLENIEHIINDEKLVVDLAACLKPGGWLLLTTPNYRYIDFDVQDRGPFSKTEDGWHVRRGYTKEMLVELAGAAGLKVEEISSCSGWTSQKITWLARRLGRAGWPISLPFRLLPGLLDRPIRALTGYPDFSICMVAYKPRIASGG